MPLVPGDASKLAAYVGAAAGDAYVADCWVSAQQLVAKHLVSADVAATVPADVLARAVIEVGSELYHRKNAPSGVAQFADLDGYSPVRVARDPMVAARPILAPYITGPFA